MKKIFELPELEVIMMNVEVVTGPDEETSIVPLM